MKNCESYSNLWNCDIAWPKTVKFKKYCSIDDLENVVVVLQLLSCSINFHTKNEEVMHKIGKW